MDPKILELLDRMVEVSDDGLAELEDIIRAELEVAAEARDVDTARQLAEAIERVRTERNQRVELAAAREAEIASIMAKVQDENGENPDDGENPDEADDGADGDTTTTTQPGDGTGGADESEGAQTPSSIAASSRPLPKISDLARKRAAGGGTASARKPAERSSHSAVVTAAIDVPGMTAGTEIENRETLRKAIVDRWSTLSGSRGLSGQIPVAKVRMEYPEDRVLRAGDEEGNHLKLQKVLSPTALVASGGICAPVTGLYDVNTLASAVRPIRDALPVFGAERGGIRFIRSSTISDVTAAIGHITEAEDAAGGAGATKPCLTITCEDVQEVLINAVSRCLQFGNFNARTHPEYVTHLTDLTIAAHARRAESELWESMCDASTAVTAAENLSAYRDLYATLGRAAAFYRSRHRMNPDAVMRVLAPFWLAPLLQIDMARQMPGDSTQGVSRAQFESWLRTIGIAITWTMEGGTDAPTQVFGTQGVGPLDGWPDTVEMVMFPEGAFLFLDGGALDLGVVRDSTLNVTNDFQLFAETFENVAFLGPESLCITLDICPSGLSAGQDDSPLNCASGAGS